MAPIRFPTGSNFEAPRPSAPSTPRPSTPEVSAPRPSTPTRTQVQTGEASGFDETPRTSLFPAFKPETPPPPITRDANAGDTESQGRGRGGTSDDSLGRHRGGTSDDSIGRNRGGTSDDSIGRSRGGTTDDSIGRTRGGTTDDSIGTHTTDGRTRNLTHDDMEGTAALRDSVDTAGLSVAAQKAVGSLQDPRAVGAGKAQAASYVLHSEAFNSLPPAEKEHVVNIMANGDTRTCRLMGRFAERSWPGKVGATDGSTMLGNLDALASSPQGHQVLNTAMADIANPDRIWQGNSPTCTVTSMQYELAQTNPGEYSRVMLGLATEGRVTLAGGGVMSKPSTTSLDFYTLQEQARTPTEALFQDSAMEFANGGDTYDANQQRSVREDGSTYQGLKGPQIRDMVGQVFGEDYVRTNITTDSQAASQAARLNQNASMNRPVLIDIDYGDFNHCVAFESNRNGVVTYRDPETGRREQMPLAEFNQRAVAIYNAPPNLDEPPRRLPGKPLMYDY